MTLKNPSLFIGPPGLCPDCGQETLVRLGSVLGPVTTARWIASKDLLDTIHEDARSCIRPTGEYVASRGQQKYKLMNKTVCRFCEETAAKLIWISMNYEVGAMPDTLAGPFCTSCLKSQRDLFAHADGAAYDLPVYWVRSADILRVLKPLDPTQPTPEKVVPGDLF
jgi:hypothetical protein